MNSSDYDAFQPRWSGQNALPVHISAFAQVHESIEAAVVGVRQIAGHAFIEPQDELTHAGERLANSLLYLQQALQAFSGREKIAAPTASPERNESGFDESKLLASIEKWQRRYQELEGEYAKTEARLLELEEEVEALSRENDQLKHACDEQQGRYQRLKEASGQVMLRVERSIDMIDTLFEQAEAGDEEDRNYH